MQQSVQSSTTPSTPAFLPKEATIVQPSFQKTPVMISTSPQPLTPDQVEVLLINGKTQQPTIVRNLECYVSAEGMVNLTSILNKLSKLKFPMKDSIIYYYKERNDLFVKCGVYPFSYPVFMNVTTCMADQKGSDEVDKTEAKPVNKIVIKYTGITTVWVPGPPRHPFSVKRQKSSESLGI